MGDGVRPKGAGSAYCKKCLKRKQPDEDFNAPLGRCCEGKGFGW